MDSIQTTTDLIQLAKAVSPWGACAIILLGLFHLIRILRQPKALAEAVKSLETQEQRDAVVEMFRIANQPKSKGETTTSANRHRLRNPSPEVSRGAR